MNIKLMNLENDYSIVEQWWKQRDWIPVSKVRLSKYGFIVSNEKKYLCAAWLYPFHGSELCMMGFPIANPDSKKSDRNEALDLLFDTIFKTAKDMGYKEIFTTSNNPSIIDRLKKFNLIEADKNISQYVGSL